MNAFKSAFSSTSWRLWVMLFLVADGLGRANLAASNDKGWLTMHQLNGIGNQAIIFQAALAFANATNRNLALPMLLPHGAVRWPWSKSVSEYKPGELADCEERNLHMLDKGMEHYRNRALSPVPSLQWDQVWNLSATRESFPNVKMAPLATIWPQQQSLYKSFATCISFSNASITNIRDSPAPLVAISCPIHYHAAHTVSFAYWRYPLLPQWRFANPCSDTLLHFRTCDKWNTRLDEAPADLRLNWQKTILEVAALHNMKLYIASEQPGGICQTRLMQELAPVLRCCDSTMLDDGSIPQDAPWLPDFGVYVSSTHTAALASHSTCMPGPEVQSSFTRLMKATKVATLLQDDLELR
eukprot:m.149393 g.149393  ORF g.149393 m.149393 type:complete len:355 (+) comp16293_c1_seq1:2090-3154(+)